MDASEKGADLAPFFYPIIFARSAIGNNTLPIILTRINPTIISNKALNDTMLISQAKILCVGTPVKLVCIMVKPNVVSKTTPTVLIKAAVVPNTPNPTVRIAVDWFRSSLLKR